MDSGNSGSISSSGDEEYDSRADETVLPAAFLNHHATQFGSISHPQSSLVSSHHHQTHHPPSSLFDLSSSYLHALSQSQANSNPNSLLILDTSTGTCHGRRSEANCTDPASLPGVSSSSSPAAGINQCLLAPQALGQCGTDPSLQLRSVHGDNNARVLSSAPTNAARNSKKRTRASRRAPTTVLTTDTSNFRAMVQEFTGIPAPPFSGSSYSRRLDLFAGSSSLRSSASHLETTSGFYPLRPSPQKVQQNSLLLSSSSSPTPSTLLHNNMVDAIASTTNIASSAPSNNSSSTNNSINYHQLPPDLGLPYHQQPQNIMLSMQNHPILAFQHHPPPLHLLGNPLPAGLISAKSQASLSVPSLDQDLGMTMSHGQVNAHLVAGGSGVSVPTGHGHVTDSEGMPLRSAASDDGVRDGNTVGGTSGGGRRDPLRSLDDGSYGKVASAGSCKLNFSTSASSNLNHDRTLENTSTRGEGTVDSWICSSD